MAETARPDRRTRRVRVIGVGPGDPDQVTLEAVAAMRSVDFFVVTDKAPRRGADSGSDDPLVIARERLLARHLDHPPRLVVVADPPRDRSAVGTADRPGYERAVGDWHDARAEAWAAALRANDGDAGFSAGFLVWGDPAFYDSTIRVLDRVAELLPVEVDVIPGISSLQLLAARHRIVLHEVGRPVHVTTGRALAEALAHGQENVVVMLNRDLSPLADPALADWRVWWGANLGTPSEALVAGRVGDVLGEIEAARRTVKDAAGWVMDVYLLRRT
ncbi:MAG TPA: precorrin-6A synthase (deacetylating) [Nocardioides sp.]